MARINKSEPNHCDSKAYQSNLEMPTNPKHTQHNTVAREYAERTLDKENVLRQFISDIRG